MNQIVSQQQQAPVARERIEVIDAVPILDTSRFEHMQRVATVMARSTLMPESLYMTGKKDEKEPLPYEQILSNCFLIVNQAVRWGLDPFAVAQCVSVVHGKLCYEGKLVSAVLQAKMGMSLHHHFIGDGEAMRIYLSDKPFDAEIIQELRPGYRRQDMRIFDGSVADWKTTGAGTPWTPKNFPRMLIYRGTRDWCRIYEPALMLGVYTDDEMIDMSDATRSRAAKDVTPQPSVMQRLKAAQATQQPEGEQEGFDASFVHSETETALNGEILTDNTESGSSPSSEPVNAEASPLTSAASDDAPSSPSSDAPSSPQHKLFPTDRADLIECCRKLMSIPVDDMLETPQAKRGVLVAAKDIWKKQLPSELHEYIRSFFESADAQIKAPSADFHRIRESALEQYAEWLDCSVEEIGGAA